MLDNSSAAKKVSHATVLWPWNVG